MKVVGIDPGYANTGWAVIEGTRLIASGVITTDTEIEEMHRYRLIGEKMWEVLDNHSPEAVVLEGLPPVRDQNRMIQVAGARGVILEIIALYRGINTVHEIAPAEVKKLVTGNGRVSKEKLGEYVKLLLNLEKPLKPDHVSDAAACALAYMIKEEVIE
mgnify:CR=1 FL=1